MEARGWCARRTSTWAPTSTPCSVSAARCGTQPPGSATVKPWKSGTSPTSVRQPGAGCVCFGIRGACVWDCDFSGVTVLGFMEVAFSPFPSSLCLFPPVLSVCLSVSPSSLCLSVCLFPPVLSVCFPQFSLSVCFPQFSLSVCLFVSLFLAMI